ncbi:hypothetical protein niasHT_038515 [Heterodera trifolii]|uniref:Uncharacterized protein n=1 Tax=Heterodera trifolii TaxID=157864 RepID=A0ABD2IR09_9BILA
MAAHTSSQMGKSPQRFMTIRKWRRSALVYADLTQRRDRLSGENERTRELLTLRSRVPSGGCGIVRNAESTRNRAHSGETPALLAELMANE